MKSFILGVISCMLACAVFGQDFSAGFRAYENHDYATALKQWQPLAERGSEAAEFNLGLLYFDGNGVPQNYSEAVRWFEKAADQGYTKAQHNLGEMYAVGKGVKRDYVQSYKWLSICASGGNENCRAHRDLIAKKLKGSDLVKAQQLVETWKPAPASKT